MKRIALVLMSSSLLLLAAGCGNGATNALLPSGNELSTAPGSLAAENNTAQHMAQSIGGDNGLTDPSVQAQDDQAVGSPEAVARLHATQKISYQSLGAMLSDLGVNISAQDGAGGLYQNGGSALGMPIYANRVPEQIVPSTSSLAKQGDIFAAAAVEIIANIATTSTRCPGVALMDTTGFTADGVTCLLGKPAHPEHVMLANQLVSQASTPTTGQQIAIAALLSAAHTSE